MERLVPRTRGEVLGRDQRCAPGCWHQERGPGTECRARVLSDRRLVLSTRP